MAHTLSCTDTVLLPKWDWLAEYKGASWSFLLHTWLAQEEVPILVVQYEVLFDHTELELTRILKFLNFSSSNSSIDCAVQNGNGMFKRTKHLDFNPYSVENREAMNRYIKQAAPLLAQHGIVHVYEITLGLNQFDYLLVLSHCMQCDKNYCDEVKVDVFFALVQNID